MEAVLRRQEKEEGKRPRVEAAAPDGSQLGAFDVLPQELVLSVLAAVSSSADKPADLLSAMLVCKKFGELGMNPEVLKAASAACVSVRAGRWCDAADRFLRRCSDDGNADANFLLGMIEFYCLRRRREGWLRMKMAVSSGHAEATFASAVIRLNGAGTATAADRNPGAAARLFFRAAQLGHTGALRDLGFCVSTGIGVARDPAGGRRLTILANLQELLERYPAGPAREAALSHIVRRGSGGRPNCLATAFGCPAAAPRGHEWAHPANRFLGEWFAARPPAAAATAPPRLRLLCSQPTCGRPETRALEFRRCAVCAIARYCSRACQALHWKMGHRADCVPVHQWLLAAIGNQAGAAADDDGAPAAPAVADANADAADADDAASST